MNEQIEHTVRYRIHEVETNTTYDDNYYTIEDAQKQIEQYEKDDSNPDDPRAERVTYEVVEVYDLPLARQESGRKERKI